MQGMKVGDWARMGEIFQSGQLVQFNNAWKKRVGQFSTHNHDEHIHVVLSRVLHDDKTYSYGLMCTVDGKIDQNRDGGGIHQSWLEPVVFWEDING